MGRRKTLRSELLACAVEQHGYLTAADVARHAVPAPVLADLVADGELVAAGAGLYRVEAVPRTPWQRFAGAVLGTGEDAVLSHDAVLALHGLVEHEPDPVRVTTGSLPRGRAVPDGVELVHRPLPADEVTTYRGIRSTSVARALLDCRAVLTAGQLETAAQQAVDDGLLLRRERHVVLEALIDLRAR